MKKTKPLKLANTKKTNFSPYKVAILCVCTFFAITVSVLTNLVQFSFDNTLDFENLEFSQPNEAVTIYDNVGNISYSKQQTGYIELKNLQQHTIDAFVVVEDKRFFEHNGIDFKRIVGAMAENAKQGKYAEGASTITQQLIKNTQLSNEKTLKRKVSEIKLALDLEKTWTKEQILEAYLNKIYFGNNIYGLQNASWFYFGKDASELSVAQSAMLAGIINAPSQYNPITNLTSAKKRAQLVLSLMLKNNKISVATYEQAKNEELVIVQNTKQNIKNTYEDQAIKEACKILEMTEQEFLSGGYQIATYKNQDLQNKIEGQIKSGLFAPKNQAGISPDTLMMICDNSQKSIVAYFGQSEKDLTQIKRQPGSCIKPIFSYAPAIEKQIISSDSKILDEKVEIDNYSPSNFQEKYYGWVSAGFALEKSLNVPALKLANYVGLENCKEFSKKLGIEFAPEDTGYALALGGFTNGVTLKDLCTAYSCFATDGKFEELCFVKEIYNKDGKLVFSRQKNLKQAIKTETAKEITNMLKQTAKTGTAKKLVGLDLASKTGTVQSSVSPQKNTDAINVSYNNKYTYGAWQGNTSGEAGLLDAEINGGTYPTLLIKTIAES